MTGSSLSINIMQDDLDSSDDEALALLRGPDRENADPNSEVAAAAREGAASEAPPAVGANAASVEAAS